MLLKELERGIEWTRTDLEAEQGGGRVGSPLTAEGPPLSPRLPTLLPFRADPLPFPHLLSRLIQVLRTPAELLLIARIVVRVDVLDGPWPGPMKL